MKHVAAASFVALCLAGCGSESEPTSTQAPTSVTTPPIVTTETETTATTETATTTTTPPAKKPKKKQAATSPSKSLRVETACGGFSGVSGRACRTAYEECSIFSVEQMIAEYGGTEDTVARRYADQTFGANAEAGYAGCSIALLSK